MKTIFVDLDDTIADFGGAESLRNDPIDDYTVCKMHEFGFFRDLKPVPGSLVAIRHLIQLGFDVQILTQPVANSAHCYSEKVQWVGMWFPELVKKVNMVQDKGIIVGEYLIDDNAKKWKEKFEKNGGKFIHFRYNRTDEQSNRNMWEDIVKFFNEVKNGSESAKKI